MFFLSCLSNLGMQISSDLDIVNILTIVHLIQACLTEHIKQELVGQGSAEPEKKLEKELHLQNILFLSNHMTS